jgi:hypothetical protein
MAEAYPATEKLCFFKQNEPMVNLQYIGKFKVLILVQGKCHSFPVDMI